MSDLTQDPPQDPPADMVGDLPSSLVASILERWGHSDSQAVDEPVGTVTDPEPPPDVNPPKPATQPDDDPQRQVNPVTPDNLPPGTPGAENPEDDEDLVSPPGGPIFRDDTPPPSTVVTLSDGTELTLAEVEALLHSRNLPPAPSPTVPTGQPSQPQPTAEQPPAPLTPSLPPFTEEDLDNPAIRAVVMVAARQQEELRALREQQQELASLAAQQRYRENAEITNSAVTAFRTQHNIPEDLMDKITKQAADLLPGEFARMTAEGDFNPYQAVTNTLANAYWLIPEARTFEFERQSANRQKALERQRRLNGVGGTSGSAPRTSPGPDLSTPEGRKAAAVAEVAAAMGIPQEGAN